MKVYFQFVATELLLIPEESDKREFETNKSLRCVEGSSLAEG